jgi:hypothetical protein
MRRARFITFIIWVVALAAVWKLGQSSAVADSLFEFAASGAVPGTDIVLAPDQVMWLLAGVLALAVALIFGTNIGRGIRALYRRAMRVPVLDPAEAQALAAESAAGSAAAVMPMPVPEVAAVKPARVKKGKAGKPQPVIIIEPPKKPSRVLFLLHVAAVTVGVTLRSQGARIKEHSPKLVAAVAQFARRVAVGLRIMYERAVAAAARAAGVARRTIVRTAIAIGRAAIRFWHWAEPYLRTFDAWLGMHYKRGLDAGRASAADLKRTEGAKIALGFTREIGKIVASAREQARTLWARVAEK